MQYFSLLFRAGYGDIVPHTFTEKMVAAGAMLVGLLLYGYCLAVLASTLANLDAHRVEYIERLIAIRKFMKTRDIKPELQASVRWTVAGTGK